VGRGRNINVNARSLSDQSALIMVSKNSILMTCHYLDVASASDRLVTGKPGVAPQNVGCFLSLERFRAANVRFKLTIAQNRK